MKTRRRGSVSFKPFVVPVNKSSSEPLSVDRVIKSDPRYGFIPVSVSAFGLRAEPTFGYRFPHPGIVTNIRVLIDVHESVEVPMINVRLNGVSFFADKPPIDAAIAAETLDVNALDLLTVHIEKFSGEVISATLVCDYAYHIV